MKRAILILIILILDSCKTQFVEQEKTYNANSNEKSIIKTPYSKSSYYFIRHAESNVNKITNPHLSKIGVERVKKYINFFADKQVDTVFTTNLNRTYDTAKAIADSKKAPIVFYDPFKDSFENFIKNHRNSPSLIVGHSNTTPNKVNAVLGIPKYSQMDEDNYSDIFKIVIGSNNKLFDEVLVLEDEIQKINDAKLSPKELKKVLKERKKNAKK